MIIHLSKGLKPPPRCAFQKIHVLMCPVVNRRVGSTTTLPTPRVTPKKNPWTKYEGCKFFSNSQFYMGERSPKNGGKPWGLVDNQNTSNTQRLLDPNTSAKMLMNFLGRKWTEMFRGFTVFWKIGSWWNYWWKGVFGSWGLVKNAPNLRKYHQRSNGWLRNFFKTDHFLFALWNTISFLFPQNYQLRNWPQNSRSQIRQVRVEGMQKHCGLQKRCIVRWCNWKVSLVWWPMVLHLGTGYPR